MNKFQLLFNPMDSYLLEKAKKEVAHLLSQGRLKLHGSDDGQHVTALDAFACALPPTFLLILKEWLMTSDDKPLASSVGFANIIQFLIGEITMRLYRVSSRELSDFKLQKTTLEGYSKVRKAMTKADRPASKRPCAPGTAGHPADTFDPIMQKVVDSLNDNNRYVYFMNGESDCDVDDDKLPYCSNLWTSYGMKRTPTKDKKLKPVMHLTATTGSCQLVHICPDVIGLKLADMLSDTIKKLIPVQEHRPRHGFFIDRGYLELAKFQKVRQPR